MNYSVKATLILVFLIHLSHHLSLAQDPVKCGYFGEPHLIPFPTSLGAPQNQYICLSNGQETLIQNQFLKIVVSVSSTGNHPIIKYTVNVLPIPGYATPCVITGTLTTPFSPTTCPGTSPATATLTGSSLYIQHVNPDIYVYITFQGFYFDIYVVIPFNLVAQSTGVCVKYNCLLQSGKRKKRQAYPSLISKICDTFVNDTVQQASNPVDPNLIQPMSGACLYDVNTTLKAEYGRTSVVGLILSSVTQDSLSQVDPTAQSVYCQAAQAVNDLIAQSPPICNNGDAGPQCLKTIDLTNQCSRK